MNLTDDDWQAIADDADCMVWSHLKQAVNRRLAALAATRAEPVFLVATGETRNGRELYERFEGAPPPLCDFETLYAAPQVARAESTSNHADAWAEIVALLDKLTPDWVRDGKARRQTYIEAAKAAIRGLRAEPAGGRDERQAFEDWYYETEGFAMRAERLDAPAEAAWAAWQARASLAAPPTSEASRD